ncbi:MAG TPA: hypothetical protein VHZ73_04485 [Vicinamibacterales bacterium]|jgi:hypothetical protein|nr:hypothetical protein [Vicinamibacterales bacterium]
MSDQPPVDREAGDDVSKRTTAFVQIIALEAAIIVALWFLGRIFS